VALLLRQAGAAVTAAHRVGVVHRDLKPQNLVLVNAAGGFQVKVLDFGLAKTTSVESGITRTGTLVGTPAYMSPEQVQGPAIDARSDLYSLAVVGYEALTGQRLVPEGDLMRQLFAVTHGSVPRLSALLPELPGEVDEAFALALAKDPAQRPADIESWLQSFSYALATAKNGAAGWPEPLPPPPPRRRLRSASSSESSPTAPTVGSPPGSSAASGHAPGTQATAATEAEPTAPPAAAARPAAPARGSRFVAKEELGRGPLGSVYRAEDQVDGRSVALRIVPPQLLQGDGVLASLVADLKAAAQLSHPNVVKVLGFVELGGQRCVVTEFVSGRNFSEALRAGHKMSFKQAHSLGRVLAGVLAFIHGKGLVHGSIQPSNVMVSQGVVKVADLGLVRLSRAVQRDVDYQAPEAQPDVAGDIFAMAAVLYHLLTGVHPRSQPQGVALPLPSTLAGGVPEAFDKLLIRALQPRVELRHASAEEFLAELKGMVHIG
jgi:serine/threonine protein kinase